MPEPIYHVTALYCGERRLLFAGYAERVRRRLGCTRDQLNYISPCDWSFGPARDKFGNALPYTLWSGPVTITKITSSTYGA